MRFLPTVFFSTEASEPSVAKKVTFSTSMAIEHVALEDVYWLQCNLHRQVQSPQEGDNPWRFTYPQFSLLHHHHHDCFAGDPSKGRLLDHVGTENAPSLLWHPVQELGATAEGVDEGRDDGMNIGTDLAEARAEKLIERCCEGWKPCCCKVPVARWSC